MAVQPRVRVPAGDPIHLYWELYGTDDPPDRHLRVTLEVVNVARRPVPVSALPGLNAAGKPEARLEYETPVPGGRGPLGLALSVLLTGAATGVHVARLVAVDHATGGEYRAERPFLVAPRG